MDLIWWAVLIVSAAALLVIIPYMILLFADEIHDTREPVYLLPQEPNNTPKLPMARLSGRDYRRIVKETERMQRAARARRCSGW